MQRSSMIAADPWTLLIMLTEHPDSLACAVHFQQLNDNGDVCDAWTLDFQRTDEALRELEMSYGIGPDDWVDL